jgi:hypothetical protein
MEPSELNEQLKEFIELGRQAEKEDDFESALRYFSQALELARQLQKSQLIKLLEKIITRLQRMMQEYSAPGMIGDIADGRGGGEKIDDEKKPAFIEDELKTSEELTESLLSEIATSTPKSVPATTIEDLEELKKELELPSILLPEEDTSELSPPEKPMPPSPPATSSPPGGGLPPAGKPTPKPPAYGPPTAGKPAVAKPPQKQPPQSAPQPRPIAIEGEKHREEKAKKSEKGDKEAEETSKERRIDKPKKERPKEIKRFGDVSAPMEMTEKKEYLINISLRKLKEDVIGVPVPMVIAVPETGPPLVDVLVIGAGFKIDQFRRTLVVPLDSDSDILNFRVTPKKAGLKSLTVEFYQEGKLIGRAILKINVKQKKEPVNESHSSTTVTVASRFGDVQLDATLRIVAYDEDFFFSLFTPRAKAVVSQQSLFGKATIDTKDVKKLETLMEDAVFDRGDPRTALDKLRVLGAKIYDYIPKQIRNTIKSIAPKYFMIETGDLLVPWELAFDGDDFLCSRYCLGKRVFDETRDFRPPPFCIGKKLLDVIFIGASPKGVPEISIKPELDLFNVYDQTKRIHLNQLVEPDAKKEKVLGILEKGDIIHLSCHGKFEEKTPEDSAILLSDGVLTAKEIDSLEINNWPLIFANACSTGAISKKVAGIGGIARSFLEAGAIAFLGPLFEIPDDIAVEFARAFYNSLFYENMNVGEAIFTTRQKLREQFGGAFWAIFSLYGDPTLNLCKA